MVLDEKKIKKREYDKEYRKRNSEKIKEKKKIDYLKNSQKIKQRVKNYYKENSDKIKQYQKKYRKNNHENVKNVKKYYQNKRSKNDPLYRTIKNIRNRIIQCIKGKIKSEKTKILLGCDFIYIREYLESKFKEGMTWDNYGHKGWHVDHIKPCCSFDLTDPEQQKQCFHYTNLQPLWWYENLSKGGKKL